MRVIVPDAGGSAVELGCDEGEVAVSFGEAGCEA